MSKSGLFDLWRKSVVWIHFLCFCFPCYFSYGGTIIVNNCSQVRLLFNGKIKVRLCIGTAPLIFCFNLNSTKISLTYCFFLLSQFHRTFNTFYFTFNFKRNLISLSKKRLKLIEYLKNKIESNGVLFMPVTHCFWWRKYLGWWFSKSNLFLTCYIGLPWCFNCIFRF